MNKFKKIGLSALAGSLVATSAYAGEMSVAGSASLALEHINGGGANTGKSFTMGNQLTFSGSGELDNGLNVSISFELDSATDTGTGTGPFDSHSVKVGNDQFGTVTFSGHGGSSAQSAVDDTATGDIWDNGFSATAAPASSASDNMIGYALPELMEGLAVNMSYTPHTSTQYESTMDWAVAYTGFENLTLGYASGESKGTKGSEADVSTYYAHYSYGPVTVKFTETEFDSENTGTTADRDYTAYSVSYLLPGDEISISYNVADLSTPNGTSDADQETTGIKASYTAGGMTISGKMINHDNNGFSTAASADLKMWELAASFAF
jgi:outer membrane protein OmpU